MGATEAASRANEHAARADFRAENRAAANSDNTETSNFLLDGVFPGVVAAVCGIPGHVWNNLKWYAPALCVALHCDYPSRDKVWANCTDSRTWPTRSSSAATGIGCGAWKAVKEAGSTTWGWAWSIIRLAFGST